MSDGLNDWGKRASGGWRLTEQKLSLVERLKVRVMPIDPANPATEWSDHAVVTAREIPLASSPMGYMVLGLRLIGVGLAGALRSWTGWKRRC